MVSKINIFFISFSAINLLFRSILTYASSNVTAIFAFGDSILDSGNNNGLATVCRSDHPPYGRNFPGNVATGRFSDGKITADFWVSELGLKELLPAYLDPKVTDHDLLTGVSFASASTGLDDKTAKVFNVLSFTNQLESFEKCLQRIRKAVGKREAKNIVQNAVFVIAAGTNDMVDNVYLLKSKRDYSVSDYQTFLLRKLEDYIRKMYGMGARRFAVAGLPPIGCLPMLVTIGNIPPSHTKLKRACIKQQNVDSRMYNTKLGALNSRLQKLLSGSKIAYIDAYNGLMDMIRRPSEYGFQHTLEGCCGSGSLEMGPLCNSIVPTCQNSSDYVFWDAVHPTELACRNLARTTLETLLPHLVS